MRSLWAETFSASQSFTSTPVINRGLVPVPLPVWIRTTLPRGKRISPSAAALWRNGTRMAGWTTAQCPACTAVTPPVCRPVPKAACTGIPARGLSCMTTPDVSAAEAAPGSVPITPPALAGTERWSNATAVFSGYAGGCFPPVCRCAPMVRWNWPGRRGDKNRIDMKKRL